MAPSSIDWKLSYLYIDALLSKQLESNDFALGKYVKAATYSEPSLYLPACTNISRPASLFRQNDVFPIIFPWGPGGIVVVVVVVVVVEGAT